ncbi:MAG: DUF1080 domain-containing protein [Verrucomicrobia bacterium]|nr:DUF1080 domain-containing protein [Verrucomicrobiota bacterium]
MKPFFNHSILGATSVFIASGALAGCALSSNGRPSSNQGSAQGKAIVTSIKGEAKYVAATPEKPAELKPLFDGKSMAGWTVTDFAGTGKVEVQNGQLMLNSGLVLTGVNYTNPVPKTNYEVSLEAMKVDGSDFFCALTFPVGDSHCSFVVGGWGGGVVGISSIDGMDASENETTKFMNFDKERWYRIRVRVTPRRITTWIDDEQMADVELEGRRITMRPGEIELNVPFGLATYQTSAAIRNIRLRTVDGR